jgi:hypothetical protein
VGSFVGNFRTMSDSGSRLASRFNWNKHRRSIIARYVSNTMPAVSLCRRSLCSQRR